MVFRQSCGIVKRMAKRNKQILLNNEDEDTDTEALRVKYSSVLRRLENKSRIRRDTKGGRKRGRKDNGTTDE